MINSSETPRPRRGRPPAAPGVSRSNRLVTFVTDNELIRIKKLAEDQNLAVSAMLHQLIVKGLSAPTLEE
jgi:hypothetical protein